nr:MAG TPA: hypothetical protein [Caudoviricetes sp.]
MQHEMHQNATRNQMIQYSPRSLPLRDLITADILSDRMCTSFR